MAAGVVSPERVARAIAARSTFSAEQRAMVERLTRDGDRVAIVVGQAGTGKTFALAAAREAWAAQGIPVLGAAVARRAARELQDGAGIESSSVAALRSSGSRTPRPIEADPRAIGGDGLERPSRL